MKYLLLSLLFIVTSLQAEKAWVQEEIILEQEDGKSLVRRISEAQKDKDYDDVIDYCDYIIENANKLHNKARALTVKAEALNNDGEWKDAFDSYQSSIDRYPMYISYNEIVKKQLEIAHAQYEQIKGRDSIFLDRRPVIRLYKKVISNAPFTEDAPSLLLRLAILQKDEDEVEEALQSYATLIKHHRTTAEAGYARINLVQHYLNLFDKIDGDQRLVDEAKIQLGLFTQQFTSHPMLSEAKRREKQIFNIEAERLYIMAIFYLRKETPHYRPAAAKRYLYKLLIEYGKSDFFGKAQDMIKQLEPGYKKTLVEEREIVRKKKAIEKKKLMLPVEATDKTKRKIIIRQGESDKHLLPVEDLGLDLTPIGIDKKNNKSGNDNEK